MGRFRPYVHGLVGDAFLPTNSKRVRARPNNRPRIYVPPGRTSTPRLFAGVRLSTKNIASPNVANPTPHLTSEISDLRES